MNWMAAALHRLADRIAYDPRIGCPCEQRGYMRGWRVAHAAQEKRHRMIRSGVPVENADRFEDWLRRGAA